MPIKRAKTKQVFAGLILAGFLAVAFIVNHHMPVSGGIVSQTPFDSIGGPFDLTNQNGVRVSEKTYLGKPTLYFFGFTHCPDICPTTLYDLTAHLKELGPDADKLNVVFVTVDPERDTVKVLADYMTAFDPRITALTGTRKQVDAMTKAFHIYSKKIPLKHGDYTMDHIASVIAADRQGRVAMLIDMHEAPEMRRAKLKRLLEM